MLMELHNTFAPVTDIHTRKATNTPFVLIGSNDCLPQERILDEPQREQSARPGDPGGGRHYDGPLWGGDVGAVLLHGLDHGTAVLPGLRDRGGFHVPAVGSARFPVEEL